MLPLRLGLVPSLPFLFTICVACAAKTTQDTVATVPEVTATGKQAPESDQDPAHSGFSDLAGTSWQLVEILSMDDTVERPEAPSRYTLEFDTDGTMRLRADCNRGIGPWSSESPGQIHFGPIAATKAMCPPGSLHDRYTAQFKWVRGYVLEDGHLFLTTMADGAILEFEPIEDASQAATLGTEPQLVETPDKLLSKALRPIHFFAK